MMPVMMFVMNLLSWSHHLGRSEAGRRRQHAGWRRDRFLQYAMQIVFAFLMLSMLFFILPRAQVSADRIADVLGDRDPIIHRPERTAGPELALFKGVVEFRNVSFRYPGAEAHVLHDISFTARPGEMTAFIGSTGSGKSTSGQPHPALLRRDRRRDSAGWHQTFAR
jgi:ATP-binding cassette subfamily B multidrug efflux pump